MTTSGYGMIVYPSRAQRKKRRKASPAAPASESPPSPASDEPRPNRDPTDAPGDSDGADETPWYSEDQFEQWARDEGAKTRAAGQASFHPHDTGAFFDKFEHFVCVARMSRMTLEEAQRQVDDNLWAEYVRRAQVIGDGFGDKSVVLYVQDHKDKRPKDKEKKCISSSARAKQIRWRVQTARKEERRAKKAMLRGEAGKAAAADASSASAYSWRKSEIRFPVFPPDQAEGANFAIMTAQHEADPHVARLTREAATGALLSPNGERFSTERIYQHASDSDVGNTSSSKEARYLIRVLGKGRAGVVDRSILETATNAATGKPVWPLRSADAQVLAGILSGNDYTRGLFGFSYQTIINCGKFDALLHYEWRTAWLSETRPEVRQQLSLRFRDELESIVFPDGLHESDEPPAHAPGAAHDLAKLSRRQRQRLSLDELSLEHVVKLMQVARGDPLEDVDIGSLAAWEDAEVERRLELAGERDNLDYRFDRLPRQHKEEPRQNAHRAPFSYRSTRPADASNAVNDTFAEAQRAARFVEGDLTKLVGDKAVRKDKATAPKSTSFSDVRRYEKELKEFEAGSSDEEEDEEDVPTRGRKATKAARKSNKTSASSDTPQQPKSRPLKADLYKLSVKVPHHAAFRSFVSDGDDPPRPTKAEQEDIDRGDGDGLASFRRRTRAWADKQPGRILCDYLTVAKDVAATRLDLYRLVLGELVQHAASVSPVSDLLTALCKVTDRFRIHRDLIVDFGRVMVFLDKRPSDHQGGVRNVSAASSAQAEPVSATALSRDKMIQSLLADDIAASARAGTASALSLRHKSAVLAMIEKMSDEELAFCLRPSTKKDPRRISPTFFTLVKTVAFERGFRFADISAEFLVENVKQLAACWLSSLYKNCTRTIEWLVDLFLDHLAGDRDDFWSDLDTCTPSRSTPSIRPTGTERSLLARLSRAEESPASKVGRAKAKSVIADLLIRMPFGAQESLARCEAHDDADAHAAQEWRKDASERIGSVLAGLRSGVATTKRRKIESGAPGGPGDRASRYVLDELIALASKLHSVLIEAGGKAASAAENLGSIASWIVSEQRGLDTGAVVRGLLTVKQALREPIKIEYATSSLIITPKSLVSLMTRKNPHDLLREDMSHKNVVVEFVNDAINLTTATISPPSAATPPAHYSTIAHRAASARYEATIKGYGAGTASSSSSSLIFLEGIHTSPFMRIDAKTAGGPVPRVSVCEQRRTRLSNLLKINSKLRFTQANAIAAPAAFLHVYFNVPGGDEVLVHGRFEFGATEMSFLVLDPARTRDRQELHDQAGGVRDSCDFVNTVMASPLPTKGRKGGCSNLCDPAGIKHLLSALSSDVGRVMREVYEGPQRPRPPTGGRRDPLPPLKKLVVGHVTTPFALKDGVVKWTGRSKPVVVVKSTIRRARQVPSIDMANYRLSLEQRVDRGTVSTAAPEVSIRRDDDDAFEVEIDDAATTSSLVLPKLPPGTIPCGLDAGESNLIAFTMVDPTTGQVYNLRLRGKVFVEQDKLFAGERAQLGEYGIDCIHTFLEKHHDGAFDIELDLLEQLKRRNPLRSAVLADQRSRRKALKCSITAKMRDKVLEIVEECVQRAIEVEPGSTKRPAVSASQASTADTFLNPPEPRTSSSHLHSIASAPSPSSAAPPSNTPASPRPTCPKLIVFAGEKLVGRSAFATGANRSESLVDALLTELKAVPDRLEVAVHRLDEFMTSQSCPSTVCRRARADYQDKYANREEMAHPSAKGVGYTVYRLLHCRNCLRVFNRDTVGALNIMRVGLFALALSAPTLRAVHLFNDHVEEALGLTYRKQAKKDDGRPRPQRAVQENVACDTRVGNTLVEARVGEAAGLDTLREAAPAKSRSRKRRSSPEDVGAKTASGRQDERVEMLPPMKKPRSARRTGAHTVAEGVSQNDVRETAVFEEGMVKEANDLRTTKTARSKQARGSLFSSIIDDIRSSVDPRPTFVPHSTIPPSHTRTMSSGIRLNTGESTAPWSAASMTESLALTVLNPASSSIWSAIPPENGVCAGVVSNLQPIDSLQGFIDHDAWDALPNSNTVTDLDLGNDRWTEDANTSKTSTAQEEAMLRAATRSSSVFLRESAGGVDPAAAVGNPNHPPPHPPFGPAAWPGISPQSTSSRISSDSPTRSFLPQLYTSVPPNYARTLSQQQLYSGYPTQMPSPYLPQRLAQPYSSQYYPSASPTSTAIGYSSTPYRNLASSAPPHGITNPAFVTTYGYGGQSGMSSPRAYGPVGMPGTVGHDWGEGHGQHGQREGVDGPPTLL